jgi:hypothetical protein
VPAGQSAKPYPVEVTNATQLTAEHRLLPTFELSGVDIVVCAYLCNLSASWARLGCQTPAAWHAVRRAGRQLASARDNVELRHTDYDRAQTADRILKTIYPRQKALSKIQNNVLQSPSQVGMLRTLASAELQ